MFAVLSLLLPRTGLAAPGPTLMATGSYVGDGGESRFIGGTSFRPDFVIVKRDGNSGAYCRHRDMPVDFSKRMDSNEGFKTDRILSFEDSGFTVGANSSVNAVDDVYYWIAFRASDALELGSYVGDGNPSQLITGLGIDPDYVLVLAHNKQPWQSGSHLVTPYSLPFDNGGAELERITGMVASGFMVGDDPDVNELDRTYYYLALSSDPGRLGVGSYWGDGNEFDLEQVGFEPEYATVKSSSFLSGVHRPASLTGDRTLYFESSAGFSNGIRWFLPLGMRIGEASTVNQESSRYYWLAARSAPHTNLLVDLSVDDSTPVEEQTITLHAALKNYGPGDAGDVRIDLPLPAGLEFLGAVPQLGSYDEMAGVWTLPSFPLGASTLLEITARVEAGTAGESLPVTARLDTLDTIDGVAADDSSTVSIVVEGADLELDMVVDNGTPGEGEQVAIGITLTNHGPSTATDITVDAALAAGLSYVTHSAALGTYLPATGIWQVAALPSGQSTGLLLRATVDAGTTGQIIVQEVRRSGSTPLDPVPSNDVAGITLTVSELIEVVLDCLADSYIDEDDPDKNFGDDGSIKLKRKVDQEMLGLLRFDLSSIPPESPVSRAMLELTVKNEDTVGDPVLIHRVASDWAEDTLTWDSLAGSYDPTPETFFFAVEPGLILVDITSLVQAWHQGDHSNYGLLLAATSDDEQSEYFSREEGTPSRRPRLHITSAGLSDLNVVLEADDADPDEGQLVTLTTVLSNAGPNVATGLELLHALPPELDHEDASVSSGSYDPGTGLWTPRTLVVGARDTLVVSARVKPGVGGVTVVDSVAITAGDQGDPTPLDRSDSVLLDLQLAELSLGQMADDAHPAEGDSILVTLTLRNGGPDPATGVVLRDSLPAGLSHLLDTPSQGSYDAGSGLWNLGGVAAGDSATLELTLLVDPGTGGTGLVNHAWIDTVDQADHDSDDDASVLGILVQGADLALSKTVDQPSPDEGDPVGFRLVLRNLGPDSADGIAVDDLLPTGLSYADDTPDQGSYDSVSGRWTIGTVAAGDSATLRIDTVVDAGTQGSVITNHAAIALSGLPDPDGGNDADSTMVAVSGLDLRIDKRVDDDRPAEGETVVFTLVVENLGPDDATGIVVGDTLPPGLGYSADSPEQGSFDPVTGLWNLGALAVGDSLRLTIDATVGAGTGGTLVTNWASIASADQNDAESTNDRASATLRVRGADLAIEQTASATTPDVGDTLQLSLVLRNLGPDGVTTAEVDELLPPELQLLSDSTSQGGYDGGTGRWSAGAVAAGDSALLDLSVRVAEGAMGQSIVQLATIVSSDLPDPVAANDSSEVALHVPAADLDLAQALWSDSLVHVGQSVSFDLTLRNLGPDPATGVTVSRQLPAELAHLGHDAEQGSFDPDTGIWSVGSLASGDERHLTVDAQVQAGSGGLRLDLPAMIASVDQGDPVAANDSSHVQLRVSSADLDLSLSTSAQRPEVGDSIVLTLAIANLGPDDASDLLTSLSLPLGLTGVSYSATGGEHDLGSGIWSLPAIAGGGVDELEVVARVDAGSGGEDLEITALMLSRDQEDPEPGNDSDMVLVNPRAADYSLALRVSDASPLAGESFGVVIEFVNAGPDSAAEARVDLPLPPELWLEESLPEQGEHDLGSGIWRLGGVAPGDSVSLELALRADPDAGGEEALLSATADADTEDSEPGDVHRERAISIGAVPKTPVVMIAEQVVGALHPGASPQPLFTLRLVNQGLRPERLTELEFDNAGSGPGTQAQLDADWSPIDLVAIVGTAEVMEADPRGSSSFAAGRIRFTGLDLNLDPGDTLSLQLRGGASLGARDGDGLDLLMRAPTGIVFAEPCSLITNWPLHPDGEFTVDGLAAAQVTLDGALPPNLLAGESDALALSMVLRPNGYEADTLHKFNVLNGGSAQPLDDIAAMRLWADDGDGLFDASADSLLGELYPTGSRWERSDLDLPVPLEGRRIHVSVDIADLATEGTSVSLGLPADPSDTAIGMTSGNDGPVDADVPGPVLQVVTADNRLTLSSQILPAISVSPGEQRVPLIGLLIGNSFDHEKVLTGLALGNVSSGPGDPDQLDTAWQAIQLWADDGDGLFDGDADALLATGFFAAGRAEYSGLSVSVPGEGQRQLFVTADISMTAAADGDVLAAHIASPSDVSFLDGSSASAAYPFDSGRTLTVNGMVPLQVQNHGAPVATVGPGEGPVLALDITLPPNGYAEDVLQHIKVVNRGNAGDEELATMRLWGDDGDGHWNGEGGGDPPLGELAWLDESWQSALSSIPVPLDGLRVFITFTASPSLADSSTVQLALREDGLTMASGNDGPLGGDVRNAEQQLLSPATLLSSIRVSPAASILDQDVNVRMTVRNQSGELIEDLRPSALSLIGPGGLEPVSGPLPEYLALGTGEAGEFTWTFRASAAGQLQVSGSCSGEGADSELTHLSLHTASNSHNVYVASDSLGLHAVEAMPFYVNQGQTGVVPVHLTFDHSSGEAASDILLRSLSLRLRDALGGGIVPADLFSRVLVNEGGDVYLVDEDLATTGDRIDLAFDEPVLIQPGEPVTVDIQVDIADTAAVPEFFVVIEDSLAFDAVDATSSLPVLVNLDGGSFPVEAGPARVYAPAETLQVAAVAGSARSVGQGQPAIPLQRILVTNPGLPDIGADVRITTLQVATVDSTDGSVLLANTVLERIRLVDVASGEVHLDRMLGAEDDGVVTLVLSPLISVAAGDPRTLELRGDIAAGAPLGAFRLRLEPGEQFGARDANSGDPVVVLYDSPPLLGYPLRVEAVADRLLSRRVAQAPDSVGVGTAALPLFSLRLRHPGGADSGPLRCSGFTLRFWNEDRDSLVPGDRVETLRARWDGAQASELNALPGHGGSVFLSLPDLTIEPGDSVLLELEADLAADAPPGFLEVAVDAVGWGCFDLNTGAPVPLLAEDGASLPHLSGLIWLEEAPRDLFVGAESLMPPVLTATGQEVPCLLLDLFNPASVGAGAVRVTGLSLMAADRNGEALAVGAVAERIRAYRGGDLWGETSVLSADSSTAVLVPLSPLSVEPDHPEFLELRLLLSSGGTGESLRLGLAEDGVAVDQPANPLLAIAVRAVQGQSFPLWSEEGNFTPADLAASYSNFPNPFAAGRDETTFAYFLEREGRVTLRIWTLRGEPVRTVVAGTLREAGLQQDDRWDGRNGRGESVQNGVYLAEIRVEYPGGGSDRLLRKLAVLR